MSYDRYVYPGTNVLVNKFGIMDSAKLEEAERIMQYLFRDALSERLYESEPVASIRPAQGKPARAGPFAAMKALLSRMDARGSGPGDDCRDVTK